ILDLMVLCRLAATKSEARRLIQQGGVLVNDSKVEAIDYIVTSDQLKDGVRLRKGKKTHHKAFIK
ncbi:MAG: S4 domain-containing protein, partial [Herbinix sp.]|nr:S4 domain-containing protein [Herbinix sp.]